MSIEDVKEILQNDSVHGSVGFDLIDEAGVLNDSVFERGDPAPPAIAPGQLRETVLCTLFVVLAAHLSVLATMVGVAVFVNDVKYFLRTHRVVAYAAFVMLPVVHCVPMFCTPARSTFVLPFFVFILGYVEAVLSCFYDTYCIFMTNMVCLVTCVEIVGLSLLGVRISTVRTLFVVALLHVVNSIAIITFVTSATSCSWIDTYVAAAAIVILPGIIFFKIRAIVTHFSSSNFV